MSFYEYAKDLFEKTAVRTFTVENKEDLHKALAALAAAGGAGSAGWGFLTEPGGLKKRLKAGGKWGLAGAIGAPLATAVMSRDTIKSLYKDK